MATKFKNTLPTPPVVQALLDAINQQCPEGHWVTRHAKGDYSDQWMIFSQVLQGRIDDMKLAGDKTISDYRVGILVDLSQGSIDTSYFQFNNPAAHRLFKANFNSEMLHELIYLNFGTPIVCSAYKMKLGNKPRELTSKPCRNGMWIKHWLSDPAYYPVGTKQERLLAMHIGIIRWGEKLLIKKAAQVATAYLPLLKAVLPLEGPPIDPRRLTRSAQLRAKLAKATGHAEQCSCEHRKIDGLDSLDACGGPLEAAHIKPYQQGGSDDASNGLWLCRVHHCESEGRIAGNRLSVRLLDHIPQQKFSRLATAATA